MIPARKGLDHKDNLFGSLILIVTAFSSMEILNRLRPREIINEVVSFFIFLA